MLGISGMAGSNNVQARLWPVFLTRLVSLHGPAAAAVRDVVPADVAIAGEIVRE
jgi:hypothetical protein